MKQDKSKRDLEKDVSMPGSTGSQGERERSHRREDLGEGISPPSTPGSSEEEQRGRQGSTDVSQNS